MARLLRDVIDDAVDVMEALAYWERHQPRQVVVKQLLEEELQDRIVEYSTMLIEQTGPVPE